jgi:hypothetical protein
METEGIVKRLMIEAASRSKDQRDVLGYATAPDGMSDKNADSRKVGGAERPTAPQDI